MDEQRKLRNLLAYTKTDTIEELEDCNKLYEELLAYINIQEKITELLDLYRNFQYHVYSGNVSPRDRLNEKIQKLEKELKE